MEDKRSDDQTLAAMRLYSYRPARWKSAAAWLAVALGVLMIAAGTSTGFEHADAVANFAAGACFGVGFALPGGYWLLRNYHDRALMRDWAERTGSLPWPLLIEDMGELVHGTAPAELPLLRRRLWWVIGIAVVVAFALGGWVAGHAAVLPGEI